MSLFDAPTSEIPPNVDPGGARPLTEDAAWQWLGQRANGNQLVTSVRELGAEWRWHRSRVSRFLSRLRDARRIETAGRDGRTSITILSQERAMSADATTAAVEKILARAAIPAAAPQDDPDDTGSPRWWQECRAEGLMVAQQQGAMVVYRTARDQVAIRTEGDGPDGEDMCIVVDPLHVPRLIERLQAVLDELSRDT